MGTKFLVSEVSFKGAGDSEDSERVVEEIPLMKERPEKAPNGMSYKVVWADGRGVQYFGNHTDALRFSKDKDRDADPPKLVRRPSGTELREALDRPRGHVTKKQAAPRTVTAWHCSDRTELTGQPIWFSTSEKYMGDYDGNFVYKVKIQMDRPYETKWLEELTEKPRSKAFRARMRKQGYDAIVDSISGGEFGGVWIVPLDMSKVTVLQRTDRHQRKQL
jgi:hypothetical protein